MAWMVSPIRKKFAMNGIDFLADTNFLIYLLEGRSEAAAFATYSFALSFVTEIELLGRYKLETNDELAIRDLLNDCVIIDLNTSVKQKAIALKQSRKIKLPDALIAATAQTFGLTLLTADTGFRTIPELDMVLLEVV